MMAVEPYRGSMDASVDGGDWRTITAQQQCGELRFLTGEEM